jgi:hypothetical protein
MRFQAKIAKGSGSTVSLTVGIHRSAPIRQEHIRNTFRVRPTPQSDLTRELEMRDWIKLLLDPNAVDGGGAETPDVAPVNGDGQLGGGGVNGGELPDSALDGFGGSRSSGVSRWNSASSTGESMQCFP